MTFLIENNEAISHSQLREEIAREALALRQIAGQPLAFVLEAENRFTTYAKFLALAAEGRAVHLCPPYQFRDPGYRAFLETETKTDFVYCAGPQSFADAPKGRTAGRLHPAVRDNLRDGGLFIVRTSGTSGKKYKFILHRFDRFTEKYLRAPSDYRITFAFSPADSIAGIETLLQTVTLNRTLVTAGDKFNPQIVAESIAKHAVDRFATTPSFLSLLLLSRQTPALKNLRVLSYGSEPAQKGTLDEIRKALPGVALEHTYGMSEIGILKTETCPTDPTRLRLDPTINPGRISNGLLEVRSITPMVGYLNYLAETTADGWFLTQDSATEDDGWLRVLGRNNETFNVGGRKFFPSELESLLGEIEGVADVTIEKTSHPLTGEAIVARVVLREALPWEAFLGRYKTFCETRLPPFMVPHRLIRSEATSVTPRFKKVRAA